MAKRLRRGLVGWFLVAAVCAAAEVEEPRLFAVHSRAGELTIEPLALADGESRTLVAGVGETLLKVICPMGPGTSGDVMMLSHESYGYRLARSGDAIRVATTRGTTEKPGEEIRLSDLARYEIRVNVTAADGRKAVFVIEDGARARRDEGAPVFDMFGGAVPMAAGDYSFTTRVKQVERTSAIEGTAPLRYELGLLWVAGTVGSKAARDFIVDFGAGATVVERAALPAGLAIEPVTSVVHGADGEKVVVQGMQGAGGEVAGLLGTAVVPSLRLGDMAFRDVRVNVIAAMPEIDGRRGGGIIGMDLLARAAVACVTYGGRGGHLRLAAESHLDDANVIEIPFHRAEQHLFVEGRIGATRVTFVFDTGARRTHVAPAIVEHAGLPPRPDDRPEKTRGLDGKRIETKLTTAPKLRLGEAELRDVTLVVASLPVLDGMGLGEQGGLLGNSLLRRYAEVEVDFTRSVLRLLER